MTLPEAITEIRELREELEEQRWRDSASLERLWSGRRLAVDKRYMGELVGVKQQMAGRRLQALRIAEQVLLELENGPRLDDADA